jgi:hypothetical protein
MEGVTFDFLTAAGVLATAVFTGVVAVFTYLAYRHGRHQAARHRPIRVARQRRRYDEDDIIIRELPRAFRDTRLNRVVVLRINNEADPDLRWSIDNRGTRLYRSTIGEAPMLEVPGTTTTMGHDGSTIGLVFVLPDGSEWATEETDPKFPLPVKIRKRYWIKVRGTTAGGQKIKAWRRVDLYLERL